ncbi:MAG TPA: dihydropyrimidinase [Acidimicrobiales bacterium]|nr:dihydropyrimidinase [Acidimicrobiales bacterium]
MTRTLIAGGTVVSTDGSLDADVLIDGERIVAIGDPDAEVTQSWRRGADEVIDASGRLVIPGGIDVHTHMEMPFGGTQAHDTFETGTRAAAWGGTTTIVDFAIQRKGGSLGAALEEWHAKADGNCAVDYGFHLIVSDVNDQSLKEMGSMVGEGVTSFKLFMAYPGVFYSTDGEILQAMQQAAELGATTMMHAENGIAIDVLVAQALARGQTAPRFHGSTRPSVLEGEATYRAIQLAKVAGAPLYFVHLSAAEALHEVARARSEGGNVWAETCPQYLYLTDATLQSPGFEGAKYVCSPPVRPESHLAHLWRGLATEALSVVSTDHCPFCFKEQKELGRDDFSKIPNGLPGVEHRVDLIHTGVATGHFSPSRWVELTATAPARLFGLYPKKGVIAPGADADVVVYDPAASSTISAGTHHMDVDYSAFEGLTVRGAVETVLSRGTRVVDHGRYVGRTGHGRFVRRGSNQDIR